VNENSQMERRLIGTSAICTPNGEVTDVDIEGLVRRFLLFDKYVLTSVRLKEFPILARLLGYEGLRDLLSANLLETRCECLQIAQVGQSGMFGDPILPLLNYKFNWIDANDRTKYVHDCLQGIHDVPGLKHKDAVRLKRGVADSIVPLSKDDRLQFGSNFHTDFKNNELLKASVNLALKQRLGHSDVPFKFELHQEDDGRFKVETDIASLAGLSDIDTHKVIEAGLLGVAGLSQVIGEMKAYNALSGFRNEDLPLFRIKLDFLATLVTTESKERKFQRIIDIAHVPSFLSQGSTLNIEKLLKVRDSAETREFRDWLASGGSEDDKEVKDRICGFRAQAGLKVGSFTGKAMRFLVTSGVGFLPVPGAAFISLGLGALDLFVVDRVLPRSGITAFVNELYPSIFEEQKNTRASNS
jgi:hypothetical protein